MGRPFLSYLDEEGSRYICKHCRCHIASKSQLVWEGYMGAQQAAILFRSSVNLDQIPEQRREQLSTGVFVLADVVCRCCRTLLGWRYLSSENEVQQYKVGGVLLRKGELECLHEDLASAACRSPAPPRQGRSQVYASHAYSSHTPAHL